MRVPANRRRVAAATPGRRSEMAVVRDLFTRRIIYVRFNVLFVYNITHTRKYARTRMHRVDLANTKTTRTGARVVNYTSHNIRFIH